jgi:glycogen debranching enzyme
MALEVTVGPPVLTINNSYTFLVSELDGSITSASDQGLYSRDTRYLSGYQLYINGEPWALLNSGAIAYYASQTHLVNPKVVTEDGVIAPGTVGLLLSRTLAEALHEDLDIRNYSGKPVHFIFEMLLRSDFADLFEVKAKELTRRGHIESNWKSDRQELLTSYAARDFRRCLVVRLECSKSRGAYANGRISFEIDLPAGGAWHACCKYGLMTNDKVYAAHAECAHAHEALEPAQSLTSWKQVTTQITTPNEELYRLYRQSVEDMAALRLPRNEEHPQDLLTAAGVPWFVAVFGRDSLIASLQNIIVFPDFARGTLQRLADLQATEVDAYRDAEPGRSLTSCAVVSWLISGAFRTRPITAPPTRPFSTSSPCSRPGSGSEMTCFSPITKRSCFAAWSGSTAMGTGMAMASRSIKHSPSTATRTWAGRTPAIRWSIQMAHSSRGPRRCANFRGMSSMRKFGSRRPPTTSAIPSWQRA